MRGTSKKSVQKKPIQWAVYRLKASPAAFVGIVHAPDEKAALKAAIKEFAITPQDLLRNNPPALSCATPMDKYFDPSQWITN